VDASPAETSEELAEHASKPGEIAHLGEDSSRLTRYFAGEVVTDGSGEGRPTLGCQVPGAEQLGEAGERFEADAGERP
jgi:hypothetical protein